MLGISSILVAFIATVVGLLHSHSVPADEQFFLGQTKTGIVLITLAVLALIFGVVKEIETAKSAEQLAVQRASRDEMLKKIYAEVSGLKEQATNEDTKEQLGLVLERVSAVASYARESDFSMSDFSRSDFSYGNFTNANFKGSLFRGANLSGADLSEAHIDSTTTLPE